MGSESIQSALFTVMFNLLKNNLKIYIQGYTNCAFLYHGLRKEFTTEINFYESALKWLLDRVILKCKSILVSIFSALLFLPVENKSEEWHDF